MRVLVVGAGVAGLAAARGLVRAGHEVEVYERAPVLSTAGGSVTLWSGSTGILRDLEVDLTGVGRRIDAMETRSPDGRLMLTIDVAAVARRYGTPNVHLPRQRLVERLADGLPDGVLRLGFTCTHVGHERGEITFADGSTVRGDVVVGADGRSSLVRDHLWGADPGAVNHEFTPT
jgi:FAD-dependent urate hydroxylase